MEWLNYHHLRYFWTVARTGSIGAACRELRLAQPTISGQIRMLEDALGERLFTRSGRGLVLTEFGRTVYGYAEEIFAVGRELMDTVHGRSAGRPRRLRVGVADAVPKLVAYRLLEPAVRTSPPAHIVCHEGKSERLLAELAIHNLDVVLADGPVGQLARVRAYNHLLTESEVAFFARRDVAGRYRRKFPHSLNGAPLLLPTENTSLRRALDRWFAVHGIRPRIVSEFEDTALLKAFGEAGVGIFPAPTDIERDMRRHYQVVRVGPVEDIREQFFAISIERKLTHPAVVAISDAARGQAASRD